MTEADRRSANAASEVKALRDKVASLEAEVERLRPLEDEVGRLRPLEDEVGRLRPLEDEVGRLRKACLEIQSGLNKQVCRLSEALVGHGNDH